MQLETKHYYDDETLEFVASRFFIDGEEVSFDVYMDYCNELEKINGDCECNCDCCERDDCCEECTEENCCNECDGYIDDDCGDCNECICECEECNCKEMTDQEYEEIKLLSSFTEKVLEREGCPSCTFDLLLELYLIGKQIGFGDCKDYIKEMFD